MGDSLSYLDNLLPIGFASWAIDSNALWLPTGLIVNYLHAAM